MYYPPLVISRTGPDRAAILTVKLPLVAVLVVPSTVPFAPSELLTANAVTVLPIIAP
jgi:hypothetical protein